MSVDAFATPADVEARWRPLTPAETNVAETLLDDASSMVRGRWPDVDSRIAAGDLTGSTLIRVVANMVKRAMIVAGSEGVESQTRNAGPFGVTQKFTNPNGNLFFTAEDVRALEANGTRSSLVGWLI